MLYKFTIALVAALTIGSGSARADSQTWEQYTKQGTEALQQAQYGEAERDFQQALRESESFGNRDVRVAKSLTNLGLVYKAHGPLSKAGPLLERAVAIEQNALGPNNFEVIAGVAKLCEYEIQTGDWTKADRLCARVITYAQQRTADRKAVANSFKTLSDFYQSHRELEDAEIMVKQAEEMTRGQDANGDLDLAVVLDSLGQACGSHPQAEPLFCMALAIRASSLPPTHMALASSCENLGKFYMAQGKSGEAEPLLKQAYEISFKSGTHRPDTLNRTEEYAQCCVKLGKVRETEQLYRNGLDDCLSAYGKNSGNTARMQLALATLLTRQGRYGDAAPLYAAALKTNESMQGPQNAALAPILEAYADVLDKTNRHGEATKLHNRAKSIRM